jgi:signal transduction histidine kinase
MVAADALHGLLVVAYRGGERRDTATDLAMITAFAGQAALAMERARAQEERELYAVLEDRERIARDLHDVVIQRLFATGLQLQTTATMAPRPEVASRVNAAVDQLDTTIRDIRAAIFELRSPMSAALRGELRGIVDAAADPLGFRPSLETFGPVDSVASDPVRADVLAVVREALSNVVRHAAASQVRVVVRTEAGTLTISVADNGVGASDAVARGGLANMRQRALGHGGSFEIRPTDPTGTTILWSVPV